MELVLEMKMISKRFPGVQALTDVNLKLYAGEIHSIIGQNGAGKSTLMKILSGNYRHDEGTIFMHGQEVVINNTAEAAKLGIGIVYQELSLLNNLTVAENIFLGREVVNGIRINNKKMRELAHQYLLELGIENIDVDQKVEVFPLAKKQLIEIAKVISAKPQIMILDEPTAALTNEDTERLFNILRKLKEQGIALVFISHRLGEIKKYCDCGSIMMNGRVTANVRMQDVTEIEIIEHMLGDSFNSFHRAEKHSIKHIEPVVKLSDLYIKDQLNHVSCEIYPGEITGFTGLLGAGQDVLWRVVYGAMQAQSGDIFINGKRVKIDHPTKAVKLGIGLLTENRKEEGLFEQLSVVDNISIPSLNEFKMAKLLPYLNIKKILRESKELTDSLFVKMRNIHTKVKFLSGGNQQKVIVSRWLMHNMDILVFLEPTRGVDVGAKTEIYKILENLAKSGKTIVIVSTDTTEILELSDRIFVMKDGKITHELNERPDEETLLCMIQGKGDVA